MKKVYLAVVSQKPEPETGELIHFLKKNSNSNKSRAYSNADSGGKASRLVYRTLKEIERYVLLEVELFSGRHHQIRAQLSAINNPVKGDVKYGFKRSNKNRSIHLHAVKIAFTHPTTGQEMTFSAKPPDDPVWNAFQPIPE